MKFHKIISTTGFLFLFLFFVGTVEAATLNFNPDSLSAKSGETFTVSIDIDAGSDQVAGSDIYIDYDTALVEAQTVTAGSYFPKVNNVPSSGRLYISGIIENQGDYKTGTGTVATVVFKAIKSGSTTLKFDCDLSKSDTSKIVQNDINATNIINCDGNTSLIVDITGATTTSNTSNQTILLQSGVFDSMGFYTIAGIALLTLGAALRLFIS